MTEATKAGDKGYQRDYMDLEPQICDLVEMAEPNRRCVSNGTPGLR